MLLGGSESPGSPQVSETEQWALRSGYHLSFSHEERVTPETEENGLQEVEWQDGGKVRTQRPCPWLQDQELLTHRKNTSPAPNIVTPDLTGQRRGAASLHTLPDPGQEAHVVVHRHPPNNTDTRRFKTDLPSNTHSKSTTRAKNHGVTVAFGAGGLPPGGGPGFPTVRLSETKIHPGAVELRAASRPGGPLLAGELGLHPAGGACLGPGAKRSEHSPAYSPARESW